MAAKIWIGSKSRAAQLQRLSMVFAVELRLKIVTELYMREMSPKQFHEEFGGGSLPRVVRNFERLAEAGWLRYLRSEGPGGERRGGVEHFYRATELAYIDADTWALLPYSIRVAFSWNAFRQIAARLRTAVEAGKLDGGSSRDLAPMPLLLDQTGWENVIEAIRANFVSIFEEQKDAAIRISHSKEEAIRASIVHIAFESAREGSVSGGPSLAECVREPFVPFPVRLSKVFADDLSMRIIDEANRRGISAKLFHAEIGGESEEKIRRCFRKLADIQLLMEVETKTGGSRRGGTEKFYRATRPSISQDEAGPWSTVTGELRDTDAWSAFEELSDQIKDAMKAGTFDARDDGCMAWSLIQLDRQGWENVAAELDDLRQFVRKEADRASLRMKRSGERPVTMVLALTAFESPKEFEEEP